MRVSGDEQVWVSGRGQVRLLDLMAEAGVLYQEVGFPKRRYNRPGGLVLICGQMTRPFERIDLATPDPNFAPDAVPRVVSREPISYVETYGDILYEYEPGTLSAWSKRRKNRTPAFPRGYVLLEMLGWADDDHLRVKLPHRPGEWRMQRQLGHWLDRVPSPLELRLQELWIDDTYRGDYHHPLSLGKYLVEDARKERALLTSDGEPCNVLAVEEWEEMRQDMELSVDEAIVAISDGLLSRLEDRGITYYSGPFESAILDQYRKAAWGHRDSKELLERMGTLHTIEREMLRGVMQAVASTRRLYARDAFDKLLDKEEG